MRLKLKKLLVRIYLRAIGVVFSYRLSYRNIIFLNIQKTFFLLANHLVLPSKLTCKIGHILLSVAAFKKVLV